MEEKAKDVWGKVKSTVGGLSKTVKGIIIAGIVVALVVVAILVTVNSNNKKYAVLFTDLTAEDMESVCRYLNETEVDYDVREENTIWVPAEQEAKLKAGVIGGGYLESGANYSLYLENVGALSTESDRAQLTLFQLNDRLEATIRCFNGVHDAVVNVALGEDRRFVLSKDDTIEASASVIVTMKDEAPISQQLAESIRATVSHSVKGLIIDEVDIRDSLGNSVDTSGVSSASTIAAKKLELEDQINKQLKKQVLEVLEPMFGPGNVAVAVNATVEMSTSYTESTTFDQPDWATENADGRGILGQEIWSGRVVKGENAEGGVVGADPNADLNTYVQEFTPNGDEDELEVSGERKFENDKTVTQSERIGGYLDDVTVSVTINNEVPNTASNDALVAHVATAVGLTGPNQTDRISVLTHAFWSPETDQPATTDPVVNPFGDIPLWVYLALLAGLFLFMALFTVFALLSRKRNRRQIQQLEPVMELGPEIGLEPIEEPEPAGADIMDVHTEKSMELRRSVRELAESNPEIAAQAIKALLRGDEEGNG